MLRTRRLFLATITLAATLFVLDPTAAAAQSAPPPPAQTSTSAGTTYTVRPGDTLSGIARKTGVALKALLAANDMTAASSIHPGDSLNVPGKVPGARADAASSAPVNISAATRYTVVGGDSLAGIANRHGVTLKALLAANTLTLSSAIHPGRVLLVPPATKPIASKNQPATPVVAASPSSTLVSYLRAQVGKPYKFFSAGPDSFDCSGLVVAGYKQIGITLIHQSRMQATMGTAVDWRTEPLQAGDLVFTRSSKDPTQIGHVGVAIDSTTWIQAPGTGLAVRIGPMPSDDRIDSVRRILQP